MDGNKKAEALLHEAFLDIAKEINNKMLAEDGDYYYEEEMRQKSSILVMRKMKSRPRNSTAKMKCPMTRKW